MKLHLLRREKLKKKQETMNSETLSEFS